MVDDWKFDSTERENQGQRFAASKVSRGQLGSGLHQVWMKDLAVACGKKSCTL